MLVEQETDIKGWPWYK